MKNKYHNPRLQNKISKDKMLLGFKQKAFAKLTTKHRVSPNDYWSTEINHIIYNEKSHLVALFKDYLIVDDKSEFLKRFYSVEESFKRLPQFYDYYDTYSKIFPNYTALLEGKFIYVNIQRKQKIINLQEEIELEAKHNRRKVYEDEIFSTDIYDSIVNDRNNEDLEQVLNLNDLSEEEDDKLKELMNEIEKNDNGRQSGVNANLNSSGGNVPSQPALINSVSNKKRLMISSLLGRNQSIGNNSGKTLSLNNNNYNYFTNETQKCSYYNAKHHKSNSSLSQSNVPLTDRLSSSTKKSIQPTSSVVGPYHLRQVSKSKVISDYAKTLFRDYAHSKEKPIVNKEESEKEKSKVKTPPKYTNNIIYIINQNPKFMTNVTLYSNPSAKSSSTRNLSLIPSHYQARGEGQRAQAVKTVSNAREQLIPRKSIKTSASKKKMMEQYLSDNQTARTRNNIDRLISKDFVITSSRESSNKDYMNLKTSSQLTLTNRANSKSSSNSNQLYAALKDCQLKSSRIKDIISHRHKPDSLTVRNDSSLSKKMGSNIVYHGTLAYTNNNGYSKPAKEVKGIQISNFNKALGLNYIQANSDRNKKKGFSNQ